MDRGPLGEPARLPDPRGAAAMSRRQLRGTELKRLHRSWARRTERKVWLLLDSVQTPWNVGAIVRTAAAYKVEELLLVGASVTPSHPRSRKTSLGTERY